jgi:hypothetical protein
MSKLSIVILASVMFLVGFGSGMFNHEERIVQACTQFGSAERVSVTGKLGFCMKVAPLTRNESPVIIMEVSK